MNKKRATKNKLNTDLNDSLVPVADLSQDIAEDEFSTHIDDAVAGDLPTEDDSITYTMGDIQVEGEEEVKKVAVKTDEDDDETEWVDEDINVKDEDYFLDAEDFDLDNPYGENE